MKYNFTACRDQVPGWRWLPHALRTNTEIHIRRYSAREKGDKRAYSSADDRRTLLLDEGRHSSACCSCAQYWEIHPRPRAGLK